MSRQSSPRLPQLDALRGLAACSVVVSHYLIVLKNSAAYGAALPWVRRLAFTPLRILWAGHSAVVFFFVLSGFVLYLLLERSQLPFTAYVGKRITRLYIPYLMAIALGVLGEAVLYRGTMSGLGSWINEFWSWPITLGSVFHHVLFLGEFNSNHYDFTIWTLVQEMRISLVFPLIYLLVKRLRWWKALLPFLMLSAAAIAMRFAALNGWMHFAGVATGGHLTAYALTAEYLLAFAAGALLACHRGRICAAYNALSPSFRLIIGLAALGFYIYGSKIGAATGSNVMVASDWPILSGATLLLLVAAFDPRVSDWLTLRPFLYLGRVSYSLYLFHPLILLAALHALYGTVPLGWLLAVSFVITFAITDVLYRLVERPAIHLSRWSAGQLANATARFASIPTKPPILEPPAPSRHTANVDEASNRHG